MTGLTYRRAVSRLRSRDATLARVLEKWGNPPFWTHTPGFPGIVMAILAQQVSLESARAAFTKLEKAIGSVNPEAFLSQDDHTLKAVGFSRQKTSCARGVANAIISGELELGALEAMDDQAAGHRLTELRGIGPWTANTYLLFALRRPDVWPSGDLALAKAIQDLRRLATTPRPEEVDTIANRWRPWRAVAARILWHHYLSERGRVAPA